MTTSQTIIKIAPALLTAQKKIGSAKKDATNPFFKSSYADLGAVMEACKEALNDNGITVLQPIGRDEYGAYVETLLLHESGEYITDRMPVVAKAQNDPQAFGSAVTYSRRYSLQSMVFIPAEDDDGNKATGHKETPTPVAKSYKDEDGLTHEPVNGIVCEKCGEPTVIREVKGTDGVVKKFRACTTKDKSHSVWL